MWNDYATAAPYVKIDMHPPEELSHKDGVFFSPHKFPGGVNTPGILVAAKKLFKNKVPHGGGGGGTIFWVSEQNHRFLAEPEEREEPGTPDLIGSVRCGMIMQLKESMGCDVIEKVCDSYQMTHMQVYNLIFSERIGNFKKCY